ncbi:MAG TPA: AMP-binding protein [Terriglobales bacterium]|nr:AMP-binding protein [Terriglobales bacterium]
MLLEVLAQRAREQPDRVFLLHEGQRVSYADFELASNRAAHALIALGVGKGDRVTLAMANSVEYLVAAFGALKAGAIYNPVNAQLGAEELGFILKHAEPKVLLTDDANVDHLRHPLLTLPTSCTIALYSPSSSSSSAPQAAIDFSRAVAAASQDPPSVLVTPDDLSTLLYTSGTTGRPKGVLFQHRSTGAAGKHFCATLAITADDTILAVTPLFHGNAWGAVVTALQAGGTVAYPVAFRATEFWPLVHATGATVLYTLGTILAILLNREPSDEERSNRLRVIVGLGSAPIRDRVIERFGVEHVAECFGSTDAGVVTITPLGSAPRPGSAGPPVPDVGIKIVGEDGNEAGLGQSGEILIHSPHRMAAYFRDDEQTAAALRDGWFHTGDLGYLDRDGWLYFVDRKRDVIRRGGENISSMLVEKVLLQHPAVAEAAVVGVPDPVLGQEVKAFVVARSAVTPDELRMFAAERLAKFQVPRLWELRESLPKTPTQRVEKYKLREQSTKGGTLLG